jgi:hypothetical protein
MEGVGREFPGHPTRVGLCVYLCQCDILRGLAVLAAALARRATCAFCAVNLYRVHAYFKCWYWSCPTAWYNVRNASLEYTIRSIENKGRLEGSSTCTLNRVRIRNPSSNEWRQIRGGGPPLLKLLVYSHTPIVVIVQGRLMQSSYGRLGCCLGSIHTPRNSQAKETTWRARCKYVCWGCWFKKVTTLWDPREARQTQPFVIGKD